MMNNSSNSSPRQTNNTYMLDTESGAEMIRLLEQDKIMTESMGGLFSEQKDLSEVVDVLDIGCGPGGWVHEVAHRYPEMDVVGIDISQRMIQYAQAHAQVRMLRNAHFHEMDALKTLDFPDASFDLVNARTIFGFVFPQAWPQLLSECKRILRPGGIMRLTEFEWGFTASPALETLFALSNKAIHLAGRSFSPTGQHLGIVPVLKLLLRNASFQGIESSIYELDYSAGTKAREATYQDFRIAFKLVQPFLVAMHVATQEAVDDLYERAMEEMLAEDFCGTSFVLTAWGTRV